MTPTMRLMYLIAASLFILGIKGLSHPRTAVRGNILGAVGMLLAIVTTLIGYGVVSAWVVWAGIIVGSVAGVYLALKVPMTAMPQMVALLNGFGGIASLLVAGAELWLRLKEVQFEGAVNPSAAFGVSTGLSGLIGGVTFTGSLVAFAKLQELKWIDNPKFIIPNRNLAVGFLALLCVTALVGLGRDPTNPLIYAAMTVLALALGFLLTVPIGGADMPVVIALLNSYSGLAAAATGFVINNDVLVIAGSLVGSSGIILTQIMCKAMNRSFINVLFGTMGGGDTGPKADDVYAGKIKSTSPEELAILFESARRVVVVPGYGLAVAQAQHAVRDLYNKLTQHGVEIEFGIHPVAGRMPGHMNVLLAEAEIPYESMKEMDEINSTFDFTDVVVVIGANDVVNPLARENNNGPIAGMPILDVDKARTVVVLKRSLSPGFAGIPNPLFAADNTLMLFADAKKGLQEINTALAELVR